MDNRTQILDQTRTIIKNFAVVANRDEWHFKEWLLKHIRVKSGRNIIPYSFEGYEPYLDVIENVHKYPENWYMKGTQIGFSTWEIGYNLYLPHWKGLDSGYALPTKTMIKPFMKTRFGQEQIELNEALSAAYQMHETDLYYSAGSNFLYFLGANNLEEGMSRPMEVISLDEVTIIKPDQIEMMEDRLGAASFGQLNGFAMEIYPQGPTEIGFESGRQNLMLFKCPHCGKDEQILEEICYESSLAKEDHPRCFKKVDGNWITVCIACNKPYRRAECGRWVAKYPDRDINSYRLPQLIFEAMSINRFMRRWEKTKRHKNKRAHLHCTALAMPDAGDLQGIQKEHIIAAKENYELRKRAEWSVGGCDVGNLCHVVFMDAVSERLRYLWWQEVDSDNMVEILSKLIRQMNCRKFVIDYKPLTNSVRALHDRFPDIVVLHEYREGGLKESEKQHLGADYNFVAEEREEALDDYDDLFDNERPGIMLPATVGGNPIEDSEFAKQHYKGSQKDEKEDKRLGKKVFKHLAGVANHYYHAGNYGKTAMKLMLGDMKKFMGIAPIFGRLN